MGSFKAIAPTVTSELIETSCGYADSFQLEARVTATGSYAASIVYYKDGKQVGERDRTARKQLSTLKQWAYNAVRYRLYRPRLKTVWDQFSAALDKLE